MAQAGLSGSEPGADLSAWLAKITARLSGSTAPSQAVYITTLNYVQTAETWQKQNASRRRGVLKEKAVGYAGSSQFE